MGVLGPKSRLALLLDHFGAVRDAREPWRVAYPLREVLFLVVCASMADCDDYESIADWGEAHLGFLRRFSEFHRRAATPRKDVSGADRGVPCGNWLAALMNRIDGALFEACFSAWVAEAWPERPDLVAISGKTLRGSHVELRVLERLAPLRPVWSSTLHASGIRLRNAVSWEGPALPVPAA